MHMTWKYPPFWCVIALLAAILLNGVPLLQIGSRVAGTIGILGGFGLIVWAFVTIMRARTPIHPGETPTALVTRGPFALNRNPIYTGMILIAVGVGVAEGSVLGLIPSFALWWALDKYFATPEEATLLATFGSEAESYIAKVRRW